MKASLNLCLLFSLISPALSLNCQNCINGTGTECKKAESQKCQSKDAVCKNTIFKSNVFLNTDQVKNSCTIKEMCDPGHYSLTTSGGRFLRLLVQCCNKNNCNSKPLTFSPQTMKPTGMECVGCQADIRGQEKCEGTTAVKCLGDQTKCISMKMTYTGSQFRWVTKTFTTKGCATPQMCDSYRVRRNMNLHDMVITDMSVNCTNPI